MFKQNISVNAILNSTWHGHGVKMGVAWAWGVISNKN